MLNVRSKLHPIPRVVQVHLAAGAPGCSESSISHTIINKVLPILPTLFIWF